MAGAVEGEAYTTPYALEAFNPRAEGFGDVVLDLTRREAPRAPVAAAPASVDEGRAVFVKYGCLACHATERGAATKLGPPLAGLFGASRPIVGRPAPVVADESLSAAIDPRAVGRRRLWLRARRQWHAELRRRAQRRADRVRRPVPEELEVSF